MHHNMDVWRDDGLCCITRATSSHSCEKASSTFGLLKKMHTQSISMNLCASVKLILWVLI